MQRQIVQGYRERPKETKETVETMETSGDTCKIQNCMERQRKTKRLGRLWRPVEIHSNAMCVERPNETQ